MAGEWPVRTIAECASDEPYSTQIGPFGKALMAEEYSDSGVPVLRGVNVNHGRFHDDDFVFIDEETADRLNKFESFPGDVLLVHKGTLGQIGFMPATRKHSRYIMGNSMMRVRCNPEKLLPEYLYYWFTSAEGQNYLFSRVSQVGVPQLQTPLTTLRQAELPVPPIREQRAIAHILSGLDDKIELNERMSETLEAMARALFKSWFVDFDPVRANADGRDSGLPKPIVDLFPSRFVDSELGRIPEGWEVADIDDICESIASGGTPARMNSAFWDGGSIPWFKTGELLDGPLYDSEEHITEAALANSSCKLWPAGTILFALYASPTVGRLGVLARPGASNQAAAGLIAKPSYGVPFLRRALIHGRVALQSIAVGAAQQNINQAVLKAHRLIKPKEVIAGIYSRLMSPLDAQQATIAQEGKTLGVVRDTLLPKLISGELRVRDAEKFIERAA